MKQASHIDWIRFSKTV